MPKSANSTCAKNNFWRLLFVTFLFGTVFAPTATADFPEEQPGSRAASLGYGTTALVDGWSVFYNQAAMAYATSPWVGVHHENRFITPELAFSALGASIPVKVGTIGLSIKRLGFSEFSQTKIGLAYGMKLAPTFSAGVQLNGHHVFIAGEYGSAMALSAEGGILYSPSESFNVGFRVVNPTRSKFIEDQRIPTTFNLGIAYQIGHMVLLTSGVAKTLDRPFSFSAGTEFSPIKQLYIRAGMATGPSILSFGVGYNVANFTIDFAFTRHEILGYTPHFSLAYTFGGIKNRSDKIETNQL
ncbi:MAG TPA: hypothetical protein VFC87_04495 [Perlabentimonas sp.]|nr:hypothetical protein [Bacteroidales bacterium]MDD4672011.1 hypothetical protein [Bacteroidales bacterium]MDY0349041.1 hypothetical protein [Tenuifilaceae bacterium]HZJ74041.1 hypothetical protein [Perlabentimonas sp.]